ncbi:MAG: ATP-binding protein [Thermodesulfobacteriota bacterium]
MARRPGNRTVQPFLRAVAEASNFGILVLDARGRIVTWNPWLTERTAVPESQALGKTLPEALAGIPEKTVDLCAEVLKTGQPRILSPTLHGILIPFTKPSQQIGRLYPVYDEHDGVSGVVLFIHDAFQVMDYEQRAQETLNARNRDLALLNRVAIVLASIRAGRDIYAYIATTLRELTGAATATFGLYDPHQRELHVKHAELDHNLITDLIRALGGKKLTEAGFPVSDDIRRDLINNPVRIQNTLSEVTFGLVPPWVGKVAQRVQRIDRFIGIAYVVDDGLYGTSVLGLRTGRPTPSLEMLQSFAGLAAVSLRRNQVEESLQLSEERYKAFVTQSSEAICRFEIEHPPIDTALPTDLQIDLLYARAVIRECNLIFATTHGCARPEEMIEQKIGRIYPRMDRGNVEIIRTFIEKGYRLSDVETRERAPDRSIRYFLNILIGHVEKGRLLRVWGVKKEISRIKKAEEEIRMLNVTLERRVAERTLQLERANKELEAFAYSVSHDLRAPLRAVDGYTRILLEDIGPRLDAEGRRLCEAVSRSARNMEKLIRDLLAFSQLSRVEMRLSSVDMEPMAKAVFQELTSPEDRKRIDFRLSPLPRARGDAALIRQVWTNLLSNAIKFSSKRERAFIEVASQERGGETVYWIRDNGTGFDMRHADKLFLVFQSLHSLGEFESVGAGLAIVQRIIHRHNGRVWAEGQKDRGAVFYFTLGSEARSETPPTTDKEAIGAQ